MSKANKRLSEKLAELDELVAWFDSDDFTLEEAFAKFQQANELAETIKHDLAELTNEITVLKQKFDQ